jgi:hypothetical protein
MVINKELAIEPGSSILGVQQLTREVSVEMTQIVKEMGAVFTTLCDTLQQPLTYHRQ